MRHLCMLGAPRGAGEHARAGMPGQPDKCHLLLGAAGLASDSREGSGEAGLLLEEVGSAFSLPGQADAKRAGSLCKWGRDAHVQ